jgi:hypothetical protein
MRPNTRYVPERLARIAPDRLSGMVYERTGVIPDIPPAYILTDLQE